MTTTYHAIRNLKSNQSFHQGDVLVLFGELFSLGYANGLVDEAQKRGMTIVRSTVGRREKDGTLRPLNSEESANIPQPFINIPLEAGFDLESTPNGPSPVELLKEIKLGEWEAAKLDRQHLREVQKKGRTRFTENVRAYMNELEKIIPDNANVIFAHLMAGGVPRAKIVMPLMNRVFKGQGERHIPSEKFWKSDIGQLCSESFLEVTAETFNILVQESTSLRERQAKRGKKVAYTAYGYHGTEILINGNYTWQTYTPYVQGWAKMRLENYSVEWTKKNISCAVYNCPEIMTNSSSIFQGVELSLYPLFDALKKEAPNAPITKEIFDGCRKLLKEEFQIQDVTKTAAPYFSQDIIRSHCAYDQWPQHNCKEQMELMLTTSDKIYDMHLSLKEIITNGLSKIVFSACGKIMLNDIGHPESPVSWINHDVIAKCHNT